MYFRDHVDLVVVDYALVLLSPPTLEVSKQRIKVSIFLINCGLMYIIFTH
jgi:hypothetical protein